MHPRKLVRDSVGFAATQYVVRAALMLRGVIAAGVLGPQAYGAWNALTLVLEYGTLAPLGTQQGLDQAVPKRIVGDDAEALRRIKRAGLFNITVLTLLFSTGSLWFLTTGTSGRIHDFWGWSGVLIALGCILLVNLSNYALTLLRSHADIGAVSTWFVLQGAVGSALGLSLLPFLGVWGLLWGWLAANVLGLAFALSRARGLVPLTPVPSRDSVLLLRVGVPMFVYMASALVMRSVDRLVILQFLGTEQLGYYSLAIMALSFLLYLPDSLAYVLYPHFLRRYHLGGDQPVAIRNDVERTMRLIAVAMPALCGVGYLAARIGAMLLLPRFLPGVSAMRVLCFCAAFVALANLSSIVLMTLGRQRALIPAAALVTLLGAALDVFAVRMGLGITGVAWATLATFALNGALLTWLALHGLHVPRVGRLAEMTRLFVPTAVGLLLAFGIDRVLPLPEGPNHWLRVARVLAAIVMFLAVYGVFAMPLIRGLGLRTLMAEFQLRWPWTPRPVSPTPDA
jgi:O-antigen/teichoic acid export membrane protein